MAFQQGLSGLNTSAKALDVLSNNIANANTVGFKSADVHFADVFAASLGGGGASQVGIGATQAAITQQFSQGNLTTSNNPLDVSINGGGFYRMTTVAGAATFTRNGQMHLDKNGYIVNDSSLRLNGVLAVNNIIPPAGDPVPIQLSAAQIPPRATSEAQSGDLTAVVNLDARAGVPTLTPFDSANPQTYNFSTAISVFDTLGVSHALTMYFERAAAGGDWNVYGKIDGDVQTFPSALSFDASGVLTTAQPLTLPTFTLTTGVAAAWSPGNMDFTGTTQYGSASSVNSLTQGGYTTGALTGFSVSADGVIQGNYTNGQTRNMARIQLSTFGNPNGLKSLGNNQWAYTSESGDPLTGYPGEGSRGVLQAAAVEESNVDLTAELVKMITQQRNYQANAQSIKTQDQILQTMVNLR